MKNVVSAALFRKRIGIEVINFLYELDPTGTWLAKPVSVHLVNPFTQEEDVVGLTLWDHKLNRPADRYLTPI